MNKNYPFFTQKKFFLLEKKQRHKKCADLLRYLYDKLIDNRPSCEAFFHYNQLSQWLDLSPLSRQEAKKISDRYHFHLRAGKFSLKEHNFLPHIRTKDREPKESFSSHAIYLDNIRSAYNVGSIMRTMEALRLGHLYFSPNTPCSNNAKVSKTAMGAASFVPTYPNAQIKNLPRPLIALETSPDGISIYDFIFPENFTLVLGNEEYGVSQTILKEVNYIVEIPMMGKKNSINVSCAFSIVAAEIKRQKKFYHLS